MYVLYTWYLVLGTDVFFTPVFSEIYGQFELSISIYSVLICWYIVTSTRRHLRCRNYYYANKKTITARAARIRCEHGRGRTRPRRWEAGTTRHDVETADREVDLISRKLGSSSTPDPKMKFGQLGEHLQQYRTCICYMGGLHDGTRSSV